MAERVSSLSRNSAGSPADDRVAGELARLEALHGWRLRDHATFHDGIWTASTRSRGGVDYPVEACALCGDAEGGSFWFRHRARVVEQMLRKYRASGAIWDIGSGNGDLALRLGSRGYEVVCVEPLPEGARRAAERGIAVSICGRTEELALPGGSIRAMTCLDVLEHLQRPTELLGELASVIDPAGHLVVTVPALPALWSEVDEVSGHHRRYTLPTLNEMMEPYFETIHATYFMLPLVLPVWWLRARPWRRGARRTREEILRASASEVAGTGSRLLSGGAGVILALERRWLQLATLPAGTSIVGIYRRK